MNIPLFCPDARLTAVFVYLNHICRRGTAMLCPYRLVYLPENRCNQQTQLQLAQTEKMSRGKLVAGVAQENNHSVGLNAVNLQPSLNEVFHVHS